MSRIRPGTCAEPGPSDTHCTDHRGHRYSCYDAGADVSFNDRQDFAHACDEADCPGRPS